MSVFCIEIKSIVTRTLRTGQGRKTVFGPDRGSINDGFNRLELGVKANYNLLLYDPHQDSLRNTWNAPVTDTNKRDYQIHIQKIP